MSDNILGELPKTVELPENYFVIRHITLDCRGPLTISADSNWGFFVTVFTQSHSTRNWRELGFSAAAIDRPVIVERGTWIGSNAVLYHCHIMEGAIVAAGAVVRSQIVKPFVMVAGNPARVIARYHDGAWDYLIPRMEILE